MLYIAVKSSADTREEMHLAALSLCKELLTSLGINEEILYAKSGKPYIKDDKAYISISHSHGAVCCAVNTENEKITELPNSVFCFPAPFKSVGVDIEILCDNKNLIKIAKGIFSKAEQESFFKNPTAEQFFTIYTKKEAIVKQSGKGLSGIRTADSESFKGFIHSRKIIVDKKEYLLSVCS